MSRQINQAVNQVRLTNVAIVKLKKQGKRFEIACYKNKVLNWRNGVETDLDEVMQIDSVFHNVSRGNVAKASDLQKAFGTTNQEEICKYILKHGTMQVSEKERALVYDNIFRDIATIISEKTINPDTDCAYPVSTIEKAMKDTIHYAVNPTKPAKMQALDVIKQLSSHIPLKRIQMKVRFNNIDSKHQKDLLKKLKLNETEIKMIKNTPDDSKLTFDCDMNTNEYRMFDQLAQSYGGTLQLKEASHVGDMSVDISNVVVSSAKSKSEKEDKTDQIDIKKEDDQAETLNNDATQSTKSSETEILTDEFIASVAKKNPKKARKLRNRQQKQLEELNQPKQAVEEETSVDPNDEIGILLAQDLAIQKLNVQDSSTATKNGNDSDSKALKCLTCKVSFGFDTALQRNHYRCELHRFNLKLKMKKLPPCSQEEFDLMSQEDKNKILQDWKN